MKLYSVATKLLDKASHLFMQSCVDGIIMLFSVAWQKQEGDITYLTDKFLFPEDPDDPFFELPVTAEQRSKRAAVKNRYRLWPNGVVPYVISTAYTGIQ